ncbi:MAG: pyridoxine 5'-phosphate synthase [Deltaproteobacteria bacterium]|nr:pyridoxine 5'-phosphate synthase [Deltaproteobacteria bacterium]
MAKLGVNIDHVATLRQARGTRYPDPVAAAVQAEEAGADQITVHLREDRRHIQEADVRILKRTLQTELNLEMALTESMIRFAKEVGPHSVTLVPEKREELTTEGGLDLLKLQRRLRDSVPDLQKSGIRVSLFINPDRTSIEIAKELGVDAIEIHTGRYAEVTSPSEVEQEREVLRESARLGHSLELWVAAGHGLNYQNTAPVAAISEIVEFNIGHAIIARALFVGIGQAVREMKKIVEGRT